MDVQFLLMKIFYQELVLFIKSERKNEIDISSIKKKRKKNTKTTKGLSSLSLVKLKKLLLLP